jgi:hypothetical protein
VARMGEGRVVHGVLVGRPEERDHWGDRDVDASLDIYIYILIEFLQL